MSHLLPELRNETPLRMAEIVWGDGVETHLQTIPLTDSKEFDQRDFAWDVKAHSGSGRAWHCGILPVTAPSPRRSGGTNMHKLCLASLLCIMTAQAQDTARKIVALDGFHNNESKMPDHYQWDGVRPGGFSELGKLLTGLGAQLTTVRERVTPAVLAAVKVFIIVDPDTPAETDDPQYIMPDEIAAVEKWVLAGGRLVLLGNDKGNAEFEHFNQLARRFGIEFLEETYPKVQGKGILIARGDAPIFEGAPEVYLVEVAPLKVSADVKILLADHGTPIMAMAQPGKGEVFAVGDPWVYNEYIGYKNNRAIATNLFRELLR